MAVPDFISVPIYSVLRTAFDSKSDISTTPLFRSKNIDNLTKKFEDEE
jgi:hypothetical protein